MQVIKGVLVVVIMSLFTTLSSQKEITNEAIWTDRAFVAKSVPGFRFTNDGLHYTQKEGKQIIKFNFSNGTALETLFDGDLAEAPGFTSDFDSYVFSDNENKILLKCEPERVYRRSSIAYYFVYDRLAKNLQPVFTEDKILHATFSPDGNKVAYVYHNDLYVKDLLSKEVNRITADGRWNHVINGLCDWVYEEEFGFSRAFEWSHDSRKIAFLRFDESAVKEFTFMRYNDEMYPEAVTFKYPKVGEKNSDVSVFVYNIETAKTIRANVDSGVDGYIPRIKWTRDPNSVCVFKLNRHQNNLELHLVDANDGNSLVLLKEQSKYYIKIDNDLTFLKSGDGFLWTSEKDGYNNIYHYGMDGQLKRNLTIGEYDVTALYGIDEMKRKVFYQAAERSPMERHVYSIDLRGKKKVLLTDAPGTNSAQFSGTFDHFIWTRSEINTPPSYTVYTTKGKIIRSIERNEDISNLQKEYGTERVEFFDFNTSENVSLNGFMIKPKNFDANKQYPVFMYLYGGPGSQQVTNSWKNQNYWWFQMLADKGYLVACVDNRGTGARGEEFRKMTYLKLGHYETIDQIEAAKYLGSLPYTDASRIGIFGWSYGGYMSSLCLLKGNDVFKAAIAVAPVTNWKWYDSVYTERYMQTEEENPDGYRDNSPVYFADRLKGNYLLVHGLADDNVHFQHTAEMANALISANKQFDTYFYPNRSHGITGDNARVHLYTKMTNFLLEKL